jgi:uncharacterized phage-associated protein
MGRHHHARTLIHLARERHITDVSNLKLQKLLYYAPAWNLAFTGASRFPNDIEAWVHGPAIPVVFRRFKALGWSTIELPVIPHQDANLSRHLRSVLTSYGRFSATQPERLTHSEGPWLKARKGLAPDVPSHAVISCNDMKEFYRAQLRGTR